MQNDDRHILLDGNVRNLTAAIPTDRPGELIERAQAANRVVRTRNRAGIGCPFVAAASVDYGTHREAVRPSYIDLRPEELLAWSPDAYGLQGTGIVGYGDVILEIGMR